MFFKKHILLFVIFVTGASVLIVEVIAIRILSPYYGNTNYTVSSVIGVILGALSIGYYAGGRFAEFSPSLQGFYAVILASGLSMFLLRLFILMLLPALGYNLSIVSGPLVSAVILFFLPSFLLGILSPYAIKLRALHLPKEGIGKIAGEVFSYSTLGGIFGSLFAGFFLIPQIGINQITIIIGAVLVVIGLTGLIAAGLRRKVITMLILSVMIVCGAVISLLPFQVNRNIVYMRDGVYGKLIIYDSEYEGKPTRFFNQDRSDSGAMFLDSDELVYDYTRYYALYQIFNPEIREVLIIGGGAYSIPKALLRDLLNANIDVAEIEPSLFDLGKKFFRVQGGPRLKNYIKDGRRFLHDTDKKYDLIFSDVYYSLCTIPPHFATKEFFQIVHDRLAPDGIFLANVVGMLLPKLPSLVFSEIKTFRSVFPNSYFFAVKSPKCSGLQNFIFAGYQSEKKINFGSQRIKKHQNRIIRGLAGKLIDLNRFEISVYPELTDNFAPVEYLTAIMLRRVFKRGKEPLEQEM